MDIVDFLLKTILEIVQWILNMIVKLFLSLLGGIFSAAKDCIKEYLASRREQKDEVPIQDTPQTSEIGNQPASCEVAQIPKNTFFGAEDIPVENKTSSKRNTVVIALLVVVVLGGATYMIFNMFTSNQAEDNGFTTNQTYVEDTEPSYSEDMRGEQELTSSDWDKYNIACERLLTGDDIYGFSKDELRIMRNWIFARHGYSFKSKDMQDYFGQFSWYSPQYTDVSTQLTKIERQNITFIKSYE